MDGITESCFKDTVIIGVMKKKLPAPHLAARYKNNSISKQEGKY